MRNCEVLNLICFPVKIVGINLVKPKTYQELLIVLRQKIKKLPEFYEIFIIDKNNKEFKINNDETLNLSQKQAIFQAHCNHSMDVFIVYFSYIGLILGLPIVIYLVYYVLTVLF